MGRDRGSQAALTGAFLKGGESKIGCIEHIEMKFLNDELAADLHSGYKRIWLGFVYRKKPGWNRPRFNY